MTALYFANFTGFWALLGIPAILLIHFLQRESRRITISTLFLVEQLAPESAQGRRFERLRHSASLWWQLLAVLLAAWLLAEPRWVTSHSTQSICIVLDSGASMSAFAADARKILDGKTKALAGTAARTDWTLFESDPDRPALYSGSDRQQLVAALQNWKPLSGAHDPAPALRMGQGIVRNKGATIFVTDRKNVPLPPGITLLAVGSPLDNVGFTGLRADGNEWRVLVRNYGTQPATRAWRIDDGEVKGTLQLAPGAIEEIHGSFPHLIEKLTLHLDYDRFTLDDDMPIQRPQPKLIGIYADPGTPFDAFFKTFTDTVENRHPAARDLRLTRYDPLYPKAVEGAAIVFLDQPGQPGKLLAGPILTENHALVRDLNWQGLLVHETLSIVPRETDERLVTQGDRPLLLLRRDGQNVSLLVNFDLRYSNAPRLPAFVLALHRFAETIRAARNDVEAINAETGQLLPDDTRAPATPAFFEHPRVKGAAHFADSREADFRDAASEDGVAQVVTTLRNRNSESDFLTPVWTLLLLLALGMSWLATSASPKSRMESQPEVASFR